MAAQRFSMDDSQFERSLRPVSSLLRRVAIIVYLLLSSLQLDAQAVLALCLTVGILCL